MFAVVMVLICNKQYKAAHYQNIQQFAFEWYINHFPAIVTFRDLAIIYQLVFKTPCILVDNKNITCLTHT